ncbi:MAG: nucleotidyltransferase substrate binding protein [bacterium]
MPLDLSSLQKAINSLDRAINIASSLKGTINHEHEEVIRAGVIQNFEFTYELCWKFIKRWLEKNAGNSGIDGVTRRELFRIGAEHQLINDVERWFEYHGARNEITHTYDEEKAEDVYGFAIRFLNDAKDLLKRLEAKND